MFFKKKYFLKPQTGWSPHSVLLEHLWHEFKVVCFSVCVAPEAP